MKQILIILAITFLTACGRSIKMSDLQYEEDNRDVLYVYDGEKAFDGEAWSDDGCSFKIIVECGVMKRLEYFDEDGKLFFIGDSNDRTEKYFNEKGKEISIEQAENLYPYKFEHLQEALIDEFNNIINQRIIKRNRDETSDDNKADDDIINEAKKKLSAAKLDISQIEKEVDISFANLSAAKEKLEQVHETLAKIKSGTEEYKKTQKEKSILSDEINDIIDDINSKYAKYYGFLLTTTQDTSLYNATREKVKASIAKEILIKSKQEALDKIDEKYSGY